METQGETGAISGLPPGDPTGTNYRRQQPVTSASSPYRSFCSERRKGFGPQVSRSTFPLAPFPHLTPHRITL